MHPPARLSDRIESRHPAMAFFSDTLWEPMDEGEGIGRVAPIVTRIPVILVIDASESINTVIQTLQGRIKPRIEQVNDHLSKFSKSQRHYPTVAQPNP